MKNKINRLLAKLTTIAMLGSLMAMPVSAANVTSLKDTMTRLQISTVADHEIQFVTPTGVDASTDTIILTFDSAGQNFNLGSVAFGDIDLAVDTDGTPGDCTGTLTDETLAAAAAAGTWGVSVNTGTDEITFTAPTDAAAGEIAAASCVIIEIGTNATSGTNQITNPGSAANYTVDVGGTFGDAGTLGVSIVDSDQVSVTATVDPFLTFDLDTATSHGDSSAPYSVALGTLTTSDVEASGTTDGVNAIYVDLDTNASGGAVVTVRNANGANGLVSTSVGTDNINNAAGTMAAGTENYGLCVSSVAQTTGTLQKAGTYTAGTCNIDGNVNDVKALTTTDANILDTNGAPIAGGNAEIVVQATVSVTTAAHNDYTDTLTFVATGTF